MHKFHGEKFSHWKFKMKMVLASMDLWDILDRSDKAPSNADPNVLKEYQRRIKKIVSIIASTWQTTNLRISRVAKDQRRRENPL